MHRYFRIHRKWSLLDKAFKHVSGKGSGNKCIAERGSRSTVKDRGTNASLLKDRKTNIHPLKELRMYDLLPERGRLRRDDQRGCSLISLFLFSERQLERVREEARQCLHFDFLTSEA